MDAHNQDQRENLKEILSKGPANYQAENVEKSADLYNRTYLRNNNQASETSESDDEETQDRTFSLEKPTIDKTNSIPSVDVNRQTGDKKGTIVRSSSNSENSLLPIGVKKSEVNNNKDSKTNLKKPQSQLEQSGPLKSSKSKTPATSSGALKDRKTFKVSYEIVTDEEEDSGDEYQRDNDADLHDSLNIVAVTPQLFPDPPVSSPVHHPGSGVSYNGDNQRHRRVDNLDLLRDHCSGRLTPCCNGGQHTINAEYTNMEEITSLHIISEKESIACVDKILGLQPELLNKKDDEGYTPLHLAVIAGNKPVIKYLISRGADVNAVDNERHSALHWAIVCGELDALDLLHNAGANPGLPDNHGALPIHYAVQMCSPGHNTKDKEMVCQLGLKKLLSWKVDINVKDKEGRDPLLWAASAGSLFAIKVLISHGASVTSEDKDGLTSLHCAASRGHSQCLMSLIKEYKADPNVIDCNGCTALFYAVTLGHVSSVDLLLRAGAQPNKQDRKGRTASHCGAAKGMLESLKLMQKFKADLWIPNVRGDLPLHESIQSSKKDVVSWLLSLRPNHINVPNHDGRCIIHIAALNNDIEMCKMLIDHAAFVNPIMRNARGQLLTPLDAALHRGNKGCAKYLQLHGGVAASKLTDRNALQKALSKAINESQLQIMDPPYDIPERNELESGKMVRFSNEIPSKKQTEMIERQGQTTQSRGEMIDASNQSCIETLTVQSQTSPKLLSSVEQKSGTEMNASIGENEQRKEESPTVTKIEKESNKKELENNVETEALKKDKSIEELKEAEKGADIGEKVDAVEKKMTVEDEPLNVTINEKNNIKPEAKRALKDESLLNAINEKNNVKLKEEIEQIDDDKDVITVYDQSSSKSNDMTAIRDDIQDIKIEIKDIKNDFHGMKTKELVDIKESINKIQSKVSHDIGNMRNDLRSFKEELYYARSESKVNTPMLSEGIIEGRAIGGDAGQAQFERDNSVMSGFREDIGQSLASVHEEESASDSGSDLDITLKDVKDGKHIVIEDQDAEARIKKARDARKQYFEQEQSQAAAINPERDTDSNASYATVVDSSKVTGTKPRKNSYHSASDDTDTEADRSRKSLDDSVKKKYKKDWEVDELKSDKTKRRAPLLSSASKQSAFDKSKVSIEKELDDRQSLENLKNEAEKIRSSFSETMEADARSLESQISERLTGQADQLSRNACQKIEESTDSLIQATTKKLEDRTSDVTAVSYRQIEQQSDKIAQETVQFVQYDLDTKTKLLKEALSKAEDTKKALEFQLKMKALEVEAVLDTAEEARKKIEELTKVKEKETEEQYVNRLLHKHNIRPGENEQKESEERIKKARKERSEFFQKEAEIQNSPKYSYSEDTSEFDSDSDSESKSVITNQLYDKKSETEIPAIANNETRETQYSPTDSFISLHDKYEQEKNQQQFRKVFLQSQEIQTSIEDFSEKTESSTWFPGCTSPTKPNKLPPKSISPVYKEAVDKAHSRPASGRQTVMKSLGAGNETQSTTLINSDSEDSDLDFDSEKRQEKYGARKSSSITREREAFLRNKQRELEERILLSSPDRSFPMLNEQLMGQKNVAFDSGTKDSDVESSLYLDSRRSLDPKDSGFSDAKSSVRESIIKSNIKPLGGRHTPTYHDVGVQKLQDTPRTPRIQLPPPRREELIDSDGSPESLDPSRSSSILRRVPPRKEKIGINWQKNTIQQVTGGAPTNVKRYQLERRIFQELLELKRLQIRASKANEAVIVKQLSERYNNTVRQLAPGDQYRGNFLFKEFEAFLYTTLQKIQCPEKSQITPNYSLPLTDSGTSTPLYQYQSTQSRYVPRDRKYTELERLSNILKRHNVDCSTMAKGRLTIKPLDYQPLISLYFRQEGVDSLQRPQ